MRVVDDDSKYQSAAAGGHATWAVAPIGAASKPLPSSLHYGVAPPGFNGTPAAGLIPGRYILEIVSGGVSSISYFRVNNDGSIS